MKEKRTDIFFFVGMTPSTLQVEKEKNNERAAKGDIPQSFEGFLAGFIYFSLRVMRVALS